jgi:hypothetical protein
MEDPRKELRERLEREMKAIVDRHMQGQSSKEQMRQEMRDFIAKHNSTAAPGDWLGHFGKL